MTVYKEVFFSLLLFITFLGSSALAETLFSDDFQDGAADGWHALGKGDVRLTDYKGNISLNLSQSAAVITVFSTKGYEKVTASLSFAAKSLEENEYCIGEISGDEGQSWHEIHRIGNGQDDAVTLYTGAVTADDLSDKDKIYLRIRITGNKDSDICWLDNIRVIGQKKRLHSDPSLNRGELALKILLQEDSFDHPVNMSFFAPTETSLPPSNRIEGRLIFEGSRMMGGFEIIRDDYNYAKDEARGVRTLPRFEFDFVQSGNEIIPLQRGLIITAHANWDYIVEPGKVWDEPNNAKGYSRAAIPFSLQEKNENCTHNGVLTFLFKKGEELSQLAFQMTSETCLYFKFDMWGVMSASYEPYRIKNRENIIAAYDKEKSSRMPISPIAALVKDHPAVRPENIGAADEVDPDHMTAYGFIIKGRHYVGGCETRYGTYPYCDVMSLPSYSTAKSLFGGLAFLRLEKLYPGIKTAKIADYVPDCAKTGTWGDVAFQDALNMTTGHYKSADYMVEEGAADMQRFFTAKGHKTKIKIACTAYPRKADPGEKWVYHTSDTYILGTAMQNFLIEKKGAAADIYRDILAQSLWQKVGLSPVLQTTRRTEGPRHQPFTGYGLTYHRDDIARLSAYLNHRDNDLSAFFDQDEFSKTLQRDTDDHGVITYSETTRYRNGFWASNFQKILKCRKPVWVPFMSGFGGITIALLPNGMVYYYVSDHDDFAWRKAVQEAHKIKAMCTN